MLLRLDRDKVDLLFENKCKYNVNYYSRLKDDKLWCQ
jgi:hypothetical protein